MPRGLGVGVKVVVGIAVLAVVAAIVLPNLLAAKVNWNDTAALAALRNLASCQARFRDARTADVDGDGIGEFGTFGELTGACGVRRDAGGSVRGDPVRPPLASPSLATVSADGIAGRSGYCYRILLPAQSGGPTREGAPGLPFLAPVDADAAERRWCAYAWPERRWGKPGELEGDARLHNRVFYTDESGEVWQTMNEDLRYAGHDGGPSWDAAMPEDGWGAAWTPPPTDPAVTEYRGRDGSLWKRTN